MSLPPGTRLGPYEIAGPLGAGAMGEVYRARDPRLSREVAVKVLPASFAGDPDRQRRFEQEARAAGSLNHPNIVTVFDVGTLDGAPYVVQELIEGATLRERLNAGALPPRKAVEIAVQIARGLAAAHEQGIVHRDLKPENLILASGGHVKILDFGLAKLTRREGEAAPRSDSLAGTLTETGMILGTAGYMAPEQVRGQAADARSDLFAFGAILHEMLTGRRAFKGDSTIETLGAILNAEPPELGADVPPALARIARHCLEKNPAERFQSATDLAFALEALSGSGVEPGIPGLAPAAAARPRPAALPLAAALAAGLAAGASLTFWLARPEPPEPPRMQSLTFSGHDFEPAASPDARVIAFTSDRDGQRKIWLKEVAGGGEVALTQGPDYLPRFSPDGSTVLYTHGEGTKTALYRIGVVGGEPRKVVDDAADGDWSPDGKSIAFARSVEAGDTSYSTIFIARADGSGGREVARATDGLLAFPRWSPDGKTLAVTKSGVQNTPGLILLVGTDGKGLRSITPPAPRGDVSGVAWSGKGEGLLYAQADGVVSIQRGRSSRVFVHDLRSGRHRPVLWLPGPPGGLDVLGSGRLLIGTPAVRQNLEEFRLGGAKKDPEGRWFTRGATIDRQPAYSPDGGTVIFSSNRSGHLDLWEVSTTSGAVRRLTDDPADDWDPGYTPDGRHILWSSNRSGAFEIWMAKADGSDARQVSRDSTDAENPTMTRDGEWIVYSSSGSPRAGLWRIRPDGSEATRLVAANVFIPDVSPDGRFVSYATNAQTGVIELRVARVEDGARLPFAIPIYNAQNILAVGRSRWMPDGRAIAYLGLDERGTAGVYVQDFVPGRNTAATRRAVAGFDPGSPTESFGISPDGRRITISNTDPLRNVLVAEGVPGVPPRAR